SLMGSESQVKACWSGLNSSLGFIRREIGKRIRLRVTPEISFALDKSLDYSAHIQELLLKIKAEDEAKAADSAPEE
ncbi:MAG: ribosome-binding factor A, partial [Selenomonas sp.]|nr:ribosome-binding factor A [Selenomonas sp.]